LVVRYNLASYIGNPKDEIHGDDLGVKKYLAQTLRLHWMTLPILKDVRCSPLVYLRACYYPKDDNKELMKNIRVSTGIGLGFNLGSNISLMFYYNIANPIKQKNDYDRTGFGFNATIF